MTSKDIIKHLEKIKGFCKKRVMCEKCAFSYDDGQCQIMELVDELREMPANWDMEVIEEIIND